MTDAQVRERYLLSPAQLTRALTRLGPTFVKVGQFLAMRPDILPDTYCDELLRLTDQVPPEPWRDIRTTIEADLGRSLESMFADFSPSSVSAGSLAQVHMAITHAGDKVAVKVQRSNLEARVRRDIRRMRRIAGVIKISGQRIPVDTKELLDEIEDWLGDELDFSHELRNTQLMHALLAASPDIVVPLCYPEFSSKRVLTMQFLEGIPVSELIRRNRSRRFGSGSDLGVDADRLSNRVMSTAFHQIFRLRQFHADMHPGNLLVLSGEKLGLVDFGLVSLLDPAIEIEQTNYIRAIYDSDIQQMYRSVSKIFIPGAKTKGETFRREFMELTSRWVAKIPTEAPGSGSRSPIASYMIELLELARRHYMRVPKSALSMYRTLLTAESVAYQLGNRAMLLDVGRAFFSKLEFERSIEACMPENVQSWLLDSNELLRYGPRNLKQVLSDLAEGQISLSVTTESTERDRRDSVDRAGLVALSIVSVSLTILIFSVEQSADQWIRAGRWTPWIALVLVFLGMVFLWRRLRK